MRQRTNTLNRNMEVRREFSSWTQFCSALQQFSKENKVCYSPGFFKTVESANKNESSYLKLKFPSKLKYCYVRMVCNHSSKSDNVSVGHGSASEEKLSYSCLSSILVMINKTRTALFIKDAQLDHNHYDVDAFYAESRHFDGDKLRKAKMLLYIGVPWLRIKNGVLNLGNSEHVNKKLQETISNVDASDLAVDSDYISFIEEFTAENPSCHIELIDCNTSFGALYIQTSEMREVMAQFTYGSLQMISHRIPGSKYTIICVIGVDKDVETYLFSIFITPFISDTVLQHFIESFVKKNQHFCDTCKGVVVDFSRENAEYVQSLMPQVNVAWSRSLIIEQFEEMAEKSESMSGNPLSVLKELMNSESEKKYNKVLKMYLALADPTLAKDFLDHWDSCKSLWVQHEIASCQGLDHQKSAVEMDFRNSFFKYKKVPATLKEIMECLIPGTDDDTEDIITPSHGEEQREEVYLKSYSVWYRSLCQQRAAEAVLYQIAVADSSEYEINSQNDLIIVKRLDNEDEYILNTGGAQCTCKYYISTELPCQHIFAWRKMTGKSYCEESLLPSKWKVYGRDSNLQSLPSTKILSQSPEGLVTVAMYDRRVMALQKVARNILFACESHSYEDLGDDLTVLKQTLCAMKKPKTLSEKNVSNSSEMPQQSVSSYQFSDNQHIENSQPVKRGRHRKKDKDKDVLQPLEPLPSVKRHNLRTNIKHKFVSRTLLTPSNDGEKDRPAVDSSKSDNTHIEEEEEEKTQEIKQSRTSSVSLESLTSGSRAKKRVKRERETKSPSAESELVECEPHELTKKRKELKRSHEDSEKTVYTLPGNSLNQSISLEKNGHIEEAKELSQNESVKMNDVRDEEIGDDSEDEKDTDGNGDESEDDALSADNEESKSQRDKDLSAFMEGLPLREIEELLQAMSVLELPGEKMPLGLPADNRPKSPADFLIGSVNKEEETLDSIMKYLCKTCFDYDKYTYKLAACIIFKAFTVKAGLPVMMQTVWDWPSHLPEILKSEENNANGMTSSDQTLTVCGHKLSSLDLNTLSSDIELSPRIIHAYLEVLAQRHNGKLFIIPFEVVYHWRNGNFGHMIFKKVHFKTFDYLILPIHCGSELFSREVSDSSEGIKPYWMSLIADVRNKTVSVLNPRSEDKYAIAANGYMLQWRRYMQIRSVHTGEMLLSWSNKKIHCNKQMKGNTSGALLLMNVESVINDAPPSIMTEGHIEKYCSYMAMTLRETDRETTVLCVGGPECQQLAARDADWLQCENCRAWWHRACAGHVDQSNVFYCTSCQQRIISVNSSTNLMSQEEEVEMDEMEMMEEEEEDKENDDSITENALDEEDAVKES